MNHKILLVDDDDDLRKLLVTRLSKHGFDMREAVDGHEALEVVEKFKPNLIILDIEMPRMNGYVTCERIRHDESVGKIPIIFLTGNNEDWSLITGYSKGADVYLVKPMVIDNAFIDQLVDHMKALF